VSSSDVSADAGRGTTSVASRPRFGKVSTFDPAGAARNGSAKAEQSGLRASVGLSSKTNSKVGCRNWRSGFQI
jgi:hypothetical protein